MNIKAILIMSFSLIVFTSFSQKSLYVKSGDKYKITKDEANVLYTEMILEDNSVIEFSDDVRVWQVRAEKAIIGQNVVIMGNGGLGKSGRDSGNASNNGPGNCQTGYSGGHAGNGKKGENGLELDIYLKIYSIGSLKILSNGGNGGRGGNGGKGGKGSKAHCVCSHGGNGGRGGNGGNGGRGGNGVSRPEKTLQLKNSPVIALQPLKKD